MNLTHKGKIGRLPKGLQEQLNRRIENGEKGGRLVAWLNSLPEVRDVMAREFEGKPIREQNLSDWRKHGYAKWLRQREALDMARQLAGDVDELQPPGSPPLADQMAVWLTARYLVAVQKLAEKNGDGEMDLKTLRELCHDVVAVRRGDHSGARLKMEQERLEREREKTEEELLEHFERWTENQQVRDWICQAWVDPEERKRRLREIFGLAPETPDEAATDEQDEKERRIREIYGLPPESPEAAEADADCADSLSASNGERIKGGVSEQLSAPVNGREPGSIKPDQTESSQQPEVHRPFEREKAAPGHDDSPMCGDAL
jgi:hypothetical protein